MLQDIYQRYRNGCMKLFRMDDKERLVFIGTAFVAHPNGYLLTAAHIVANHEKLMVAPVPTEEGFHPVSSEALSAFPVEMVRIDKDRDVALLRFEDNIEISMPDHVLGAPEATVEGTSVACLGFAFGTQWIYNQVLQQAVVSAKMISTNDTNLFLFDTRVHNGSVGGPLVNQDDHRVIGIVSGRFDPLEATPAVDGEERMPTSFSYAVSIEYAVALMEQEGLELGIVL